LKSITYIPINSPILIAITFFIAVISGNTAPEPLQVNGTILELVEQVNPELMEEAAINLLNFHTRHTYSDTLSDTLGIGAARRWMLGQYENFEVDATMYRWNGFRQGDHYPCYNVHATIHGQDENAGILVLGAHLDSRGTDRNDVGEFAPGIDDDGSGCLALLEIGRILSDFNTARTTILSAFTGEEQGLLGARAFSDELDDESESVYAMINMDMIGHIVYPNGVIDSSTVRVFSAGPAGSTSRQLARYIKWVGEGYSDGLTVNIIPQQDRGGRSGDHIPFSDNGFPAARMIETAEDVNFQHGPDDIPVNMSFRYAGKVTRLVLGVTSVLSMAQDTPPSPDVINAGDGHSLLVSWPDSLCGDEGDQILVAYRSTDSLYWQDIVEAGIESPFVLSDLVSGTEYNISIAISGQNGLPSRFSSENSAIPDSIPSLPVHFETTSTRTGIDLLWAPGIEINTESYLIERKTAEMQFEQIADINHPDSSWTDDQVEEGRMYLYRIRVRNSLGVMSDYSPVEEGRIATHHLGVIMVDNTPDGSSTDRPDDDEVDEFYLEVLQPFDLTAVWDRSDSLMIESTLSDADLAPYSLVLIHSDGVSASYDEDSTAIRKYLANGGKVLLSGLRLSSALGGKRDYSNQFLRGELMNDLFGIDSIDVAFPGRNWFIGASGQLGYPDVEFDFDRIQDRDGQIFMDAIMNDAPIQNADIIATYVSADGQESEFHGRAVAIRDNDDNPDWIMIDFPAFNMNSETIIPFLRMALEDLNTPMFVSQMHHSSQPKSLELSPAYPNPFNSNVTVKYSLRGKQAADLYIFDTNGRNVLTTKIPVPVDEQGTFLWNASNQPSGVYMCKLASGSFSSTIKIVLIR